MISPRDIEAAICPETKAIVCTHASNLTGNGTRNTAFFEGSYWSPDNQNADVPLPRWLNQASKYTDGTRFLF